MKTIYLHGFSGDGASLNEFVGAVDLPDSYAIDLPSFGRNTIKYESSWDGYIDASMQTIQAVAGDGEYRLIGHSHGAMVAYGLALKYPRLVKDIVLICPVASGTNLGKAFLRANELLRKVIGDRMTLGIHKLRPVVDVVTRVGKQSDWPAGSYDRIKQIRRQESSRYNAEMLNVLSLIPSFRLEFSHSRLALPAKLIFAHKDLLVSTGDVEWYKKRLPRATIEWCRGGHVAPVVFPMEVAKIIREHVGMLNKTSRKDL